MRGNQVTQKAEAASVWFGGRLRLLILPLAVVGLLVLSASPALGAKTHRLITTFGEWTQAIAVDESTGNVIAVHQQNLSGGYVLSVDIYGSEGGPPSGVAKSEVGDFPRAIDIAVDNSAISPSQGAIYVGEFVGEKGGGAVKKLVLNPGSEEYELKEELSATPAFESVTGTAVDSKGNVFVADVLAKEVIEFDPAGNQVARLDFSDSIGAPVDVAADSAGDLFVKSVRETTGSSESSIYRLKANGSGEIEPGAEAEQIVEPGEGGSGPSDLAIDPGSGILYVSVRPYRFGHSRVDLFSTSCTTVGEGKEEHCAPEGEFGANSNPYQLAVNSNTGLTYVRVFGNGPTPYIALFGPTVTVPGVETGKAGNVAGTSATLAGTVDPSGLAVDECKFEWGTSESYGQTAPCAESPSDIGAGNGPVAVHADISGLGLGNQYHFRLLATNENTVPNEVGPSVGADAIFSTPGPQIHGESLLAVTDTTAKLEGKVNPNEEATSYVFEYVTQAEFDESQWANASSAPLGGAAIGAGNVDVTVAQQLSGLAPGTAYRFRLSATNATGTAHGPGQALMTYAEAPAGLPDGRAYEQVTPVDKNGAAPTMSFGTVQAARNGDGIIYLSHGGIPGTEGSQQFPTYLASRGADWSSQGLLPPGSLGSAAAMWGWSEDLSRSYLVQAKLPGDPFSFFERDSATHALRPISTDGGNAILTAFIYVGAAEDGSVVLFEAETAPHVLNTFVWDRASGTVSLAGALPGGSAPPKGSLAGSNVAGTRYQILQAEHAVSSDGSRFFFTDAGTTQLYLRQNPAAEEEECADPSAACTVQLSKSQRTPVDPLDPKGKKPATFWQATPDGEKAFFTSAAKLTDDATTGPKDEGNDLYRYDAQSGQLIDIAPHPADPKGADVLGVLGASADGSYVYFAANGVLSNTPNSEGESASQGNCTGVSQSNGGVGACNLYLWHEGTTAFVARLTLQVDVSPIAGPDSSNWIPNKAKTARVTDDGQTLLFSSQSRLSAYDNHGLTELYRYQAASGELGCISCNPVGTAPRGSASLQSLITGLGYAISAVLPRNLSSDGNRVFFETPDKLVASDVNGDAQCPTLSGSEAARQVRFCQDVYEWEAAGSGSCQSDAQNGGCLYLVSTGTSGEPSYFSDAGASGNDVFFYTDRSLVGQDKDRIVDIYDARVGGGIASQNPPPPPPVCEGEACKGALPPVPVSESAGSASFSGPGNQNPKAQRKGKKKKHHHSKKKHQSKRHASKKSR